MQSTGIYKSLLLAGCAGTIVLAAPAAAQQAPSGDILADEAGTPADAGTIVVTGSRIQRPDFTSTSPMVSIDEALLEQSSTAAIEQNLNRLPQFTPAKTPTGGGDIQPTATNTPGAATVSLRGLGANRNLVLLDGRRATPSNAAGIVDINTIPSAAVERVEIISGGASATYGADAVAGVTNFILKKNFRGLELDGSVAMTQEADGFEYQLSGIMGSDFDDGRGNVSIAMSMNSREGNYQRDRDWYQDFWRDPNNSTNRFFPLYPGINLGFGNAPSNAEFFSNFPGANPVQQNIRLRAPGLDPTVGANYTCDNVAVANPIFSGLCNVVVTPGGPVNVLGGIQGFGVYVNQDGSLFTTGANQAGGVSQYNGQTLQGDIATVRANGALNFVDTNPYLILPLTRYNMFMRGNYELNDWIGVFAQGLYSTTETQTTQQGGSITGGWDVFVPYGTGVYTGSANPSTAYGGQGNPSSVILNGMTFNGASYVDPTPGVLSDNPTNPGFAAEYGSQFSCALQAIGGCSNNQVIGQFLPQDVQDLLNSRVDPNGRVELLYGFPQDRSVTNKVTTYNLLAGLEGSIPGTDWTWEAFVNHGSTTTFTRQTGVFSLTRLRTLLTSPGFGRNFTANSNEASARPAFGANFASCTSGMNIFTLPWDQISQDCKEAIRADLKNNQEITQTIAETNIQGTLFNLPAGELRAALGASYRELNFEFYNDTITGQGQSFLDQAVGIYPSSDTFGGYAVKEAYGELLIPVLSDLPFIRQLNLEVGGRYSDYDTTGGSWTYKVLGDWEVTDWLRVRGGFNRAERAPNIAELYQAPSQIFGGNALGDLCTERATYRVSAGVGVPGAADVKAVCSAVMDATGGAGTAAGYYGRPLAAQPTPGFGFAWTNAVGNPNLKPEQADTWSAGIVVESPFRNAMLDRLRLTVDWWSIHLTDAIGLETAGIALQQCLDPVYNPAVAGAAGNPAQAAAAAAADACRGIRYDPAPVFGAANFDVSYVNAGEVKISGIDAQLDWAADIGPGTLSLNALVNYYLEYKSRELASNPLVDFVGTLGTAQNGLNPGAFEYRVLATVGYGIGPARVSLQWQHLPSVEQESAAIAPSIFTGYPSYNLFNLNATYQLNEDVGIRFGVDNLFNKRPPIGNVNTVANPTNFGATSLAGGAFNSGFYDTNGRRFYLGANARF
jgi:outer membrane receptor protein involved in Fe transport